MRLDNFDRLMAGIIVAGVLSVVAGGCQYLTKGVDRFSDQMVEQVSEYCDNPYHRRLAIYIFVEGELKPYGHTIAVYCKGDEIDEAAPLDQEI